MKLFIVWILSSVLLAQSLMPRALIQLLQSPDVWSHYYEHQQEQTLSFLDYLWMHYSADSQHTKEKKHHLPSFDFNSVAYLFVLPCAALVLDQQHLISFLDRGYFCWSNHYAFQPSGALICPPRA